MTQIKGPFPYWWLFILVCMCVFVWCVVGLFIRADGDGEMMIEVPSRRGPPHRVRKFTNRFDAFIENGNPVAEAVRKNQRILVEEQLMEFLDTFPAKFDPSDEGDMKEMIRLGKEKRQELEARYRKGN